MDDTTAHGLLHHLERHGQFGLSTGADDRVRLYFTSTEQLRDLANQVKDCADRVVEAVTKGQDPAGALRGFTQPLGLLSQVAALLHQARL